MCNKPHVNFGVEEFNCWRSTDSGGLDKVARKSFIYIIIQYNFLRDAFPFRGLLPMGGSLNSKLTVIVLSPTVPLVVISESLFLATWAGGISPTLLSAAYVI